MHSGRLFSVLVIWLIVTTSAAWAEQARTNVGVLTCTLVKPDKDVGQKMTCEFKAAENSTGPTRSIAQPSAGANGG